MEVVRPVGGRHTLELALAPWVRASDVRADVQDDPHGRGMRILAYALYDVAQTDGAAHVVYHARQWHLVLCATYSKGLWHDAYGARLVVPVDARGAASELRPFTLYDTHVVGLACERGVAKLELGADAVIRLVRVARLGASDALGLAMHVFAAANTAPIFPGTHVLADLREFAAQEGGLLAIIEDPYERAFTTFHTKLTAFAKVGLVGASMGAHYGRVLLSLFRMFASTDLDLDNGPVCVLLRAHRDGHCRVVDDETVEDLARRVGAAYATSGGARALDYIGLIANFVGVTLGDARDGSEALERLEKETRERQQKDDKWNATKGLLAAGVAGLGTVYYAVWPIVSELFATTAIGSVIGGAVGAGLLSVGSTSARFE